MSCPSILKDLRTGTPVKFQGKYWMTWCGQSVADPRGKIGLAYSTDLLTWTESADSPILIPDIDEPHAYLIYSYGSPTMFNWNGTVYLFLNAMSVRPPEPNSEPGAFINVLAKAASSDLGDWTLISEAVTFRSNVWEQVDDLQMYTGCFTLTADGALYYYYNGANNTGVEKISCATVTAGTPTDVDADLHLGFNRVVDDLAIAWDMGASELGIATSGADYVDIDVTAWAPLRKDHHSPSVAMEVTGSNGSTVQYTVTGVIENEGYRVIVGGNTVFSGEGPNLTFNITGGDYTIWVMWDPSTEMRLVLLTVDMVGIGMVVSIIGSWVVPFIRAQDRKKHLSMNMTVPMLIRTMVFIVIGITLWVLLRNMALNLGG